MQSTAAIRRSKSEIAKQLILNTMLVFSLLAVVLAVGWAVFIKTDDAFLFGYKPYIVVSESMEPSIQKYAFVLIKQGGFDDVEVGDVIAFRSALFSGAPVLHRVVSISPVGLVTKGDAANTADEYIVTRDNFLGCELWHTNLTSILYRMCQTPQGFFMVVILPSMIVITLLVVLNSGKKKSGHKPENER